MRQSLRSSFEHDSIKTFLARSTSLCNVSYYFVFLFTSYIICLAVGGGLGLALTQTYIAGGDETASDKPMPESEVPENSKHEIQNEDGMQWRVRHKPPDCLEESDTGDRLEVHYTGYLENGMVFDSSSDKNRPPIGFVLGARQVIEGWEKGLRGMCVGEKRRLVVPPHLGYGDTGYPPTIPPRAKLLFEVTLMSLQKMNAWSNHVNQGVNAIKLFGPPLLLVYVVYYLWKQYRKQETEMKDEKKKSKKRK